MVAVLAVLLALVATATASADDVQPQSCGRFPSQVVYEWASMSVLNTSTYNSDKTFMSLQKQNNKKRLNWNLQLRSKLQTMKVDIKVAQLKQTCSYTVIDLKNIDFCQNASKIALAYGILLGFEDSNPAIISGDTPACPFQKGPYTCTDFMAKPPQLSPWLIPGRTSVEMKFSSNDTPIMDVGLIVNISC